MKFLWFLVLLCPLCGEPVSVGMEQLLTPKYVQHIQGKRIGLITNHTAVTSSMKSSLELLEENAGRYGYRITALFAPEHGIDGAAHANELIEHRKGKIPVYSLHGATKRPTDKMLKGIDLLIYDIQDIGSRSYTYISTLFYVMEEAAKRKIPVVVTDRPNPINGIVVDGPMLEDKWRSFLGYVNVPYCHGMTVGELAHYFNQEYRTGCHLHVIPMKGWKREMSFHETGLKWIPTSPHIPESDTPYYYPMTGIIGELNLVNIGVGYTLPFKVIGAPWINAKNLAKSLNDQHLPGVIFYPFHYKPFYGRFAKEPCQGVLIVVKDPLDFKPVMTQYTIIGLLKSLYPKQFAQSLKKTKNQIELFNKVNGTNQIFSLISEQPYPAWSLRGVHQKERDRFLKIRQKYLTRGY